MQQLEHPDIALAQCYGTDAAYVKEHGHEPRVVDTCSECLQDIVEGEMMCVIEAGGYLRAYHQDCIEFHEAEYSIPCEPPDYIDPYDPADHPGFED